MIALFGKRRVSRSIALRLAAGVLPSVLALALVAGLFYYGQYGRVAPRVMLIVASVLTVTALAVAWWNATYFADRLARLAQSTTSASPGTTDEFDRIEEVVGHLGSALSAAEAERVRTAERAARGLKQLATMLAGAVSDAIAQLDQVRLPLQILLESPFGELNENQEELLRDARAAADAIDAALRRLGEVADIDRDALPVQRELVQINDVVRAVLPVARAAAERRGARCETALEPGLPRVVADRARLAEALALLLAESADNSSSSTSMRITTARAGSSALIHIMPVGSTAASTLADITPRILASRLVEVQGGNVTLADGMLTVRVGDERAQ